MPTRLDRFTRAGLTFDVTDTGPLEGRAVVLLHGFPEDRHCWSAIGGSLSAGGYRVLAPDQRGYSPGARPSGRRAYAMTELVADVLALADAAGCEHFDVVGHDWGGGVAWDLAARHPSLVTTVTALSTPHPQAFLASMLKSSQLTHSWYMAFFQLPMLPEIGFRSAGGARIEASLRKSGLDAESAARYRRRFVEQGAMTGPINWYRALPFAGRDRTPPVTVPALYIWGDGDGFLTRKAAELTARYVEGPYRFEALAGASHWLPTDAAGRVSELLLEHLGAH